MLINKGRTPPTARQDDIVPLLTSPFGNAPFGSLGTVNYFLRKRYFFMPTSPPALTRSSHRQRQATSLEQANRELKSEIERRQRVENQLREANEQWQTTFDSMPDFISIHDRDYRQESLGGEKIGFPHVHPELRLANDLWPISGDRNQLSTVLRNIFYNAAEAMPNGGRLTIEAINTPLGDDCPLDGDAVLLRLTDEGVGISPEIIDKVFDPYFTTTAKGATKGKGLGLALCHSIITKHHGLISISSVKDQGTTVSIYLPAITSASPC